MNGQQKIIRYGLYILGLLILALGLTMNTKTGMGVSPIISIAYSVSLLWNLNFGDMTFLLYLVCVAVEIALQRKQNLIRNLVQIPISLVFSRVLNLYDVIIVYDCTKQPLVMKLLLLAAAMICTGVGAALTVQMQLPPNPGDGIVAAIGMAIGKEQGIAKNIVDTCCVISTCILGLVVAGKIVGIGLGTVLAMICVGRVISLFNGTLRVPLCTAAGLMEKGESLCEVPATGR